jgi:hypothetical protein
MCLDINGLEAVTPRFDVQSMELMAQKQQSIIIIPGTKYHPPSPGLPHGSPTMEGTKELGPGDS